MVNLNTPLKFKASSDPTWIIKFADNVNVYDNFKNLFTSGDFPLALRRKGAPTLLNSHLFDCKRPTEGGYVLIQHHVFL